MHVNLLKYEYFITHNRGTLNKWNFVWYFVIGNSFNNKVPLIDVG